MKSIFLYASIALMGFGLVLLLNSNDAPNQTEVINNVSMVDGQQLISIRAKGGYNPRLTVAKAGVPTKLKVETNGTFDCSSSLVIPGINFATNLNPTGIQEVELPAQKAGSTLTGVCGMGMYNFAIKFE